jgi:dipeptidyl aminopeptidase/acylaminoacyl peptidase
MSQAALVDTTRQVVSHGAVLAASRSLPTTIWTPTSGGPYPLVVFVHGYNIGPLQYQRFCSTLASAGYVVAAPSFPLEDPSRGFGLDRGDIPNEATDVSFVITSLLAESGARKIDPTRVAAVGHSDGADVVLLVGYGSGHVDPRVRAVVADAPDPMTGAIQASSTPLLLVQGTADSVVPYSASQDVFGQIRGPVDYLSLVGADHLPPIAGPTPWTPVLDESVAAFLDATVAGRGPGVASLSTALSASTLVRFNSKS